MNQQKRLLLIMEELEKKKSLGLQDIIQLTGASRDTTRRDIIRLADENLVTRNYGGISLTNAFNKIDGYLARTNDLITIKKKLAKKAAELADQGQTIYFDVSTTIAFVPQFLPKQSLYTLTNSLDIADQLLRTTENQTTLLGGLLDRNSRSVFGGKPLLEIAKYHIDLAFLSCAGLDERGIYYAHDEDIAMKEKIREQSKMLILICDHTKIGLAHNFLLYSFPEIDYLVTDEKIPLPLAEKIGKEKIIYIKK